MVSSVLSNKLLFPILLLGINIIYISFLIKALFDAPAPVLGGFALLVSPLIASISIFYIGRKQFENKSGYVIQILQIINWLFIVFPVAVLILIVLAGSGV